MMNKTGRRQSKAGSGLPRHNAYRIRGTLQAKTASATWGSYQDEMCKIAVLPALPALAAGAARVGLMARAMPFLRTIGKSFMNPIKTTGRMYKTPKGWDKLKTMAAVEGPAGDAARKAMNRRGWHRGASLVGPTTMIGAPSYAAGSLTSGGGSKPVSSYGGGYG
jgi:hypothetical protein